MRLCLLVLLLGCFLAAHAESSTEPYAYDSTESPLPEKTPSTAEPEPEAESEQNVQIDSDDTGGEVIGSEDDGSGKESMEWANEILDKLLKGSKSYTQNKNHYGSYEYSSDSDEREGSLESMGSFDSSGEEYYGKGHSEDSNEGSGESAEEMISQTVVEKLGAVLGAILKTTVASRLENLKEKWGMGGWKHWKSSQDWQSKKENMTDEWKRDCPMKNKTEPILNLIRRTYHAMSDLPPGDSNESMANRTAFVKSFLSQLKNMVFSHRPESDYHGGAPHRGRGPRPYRHGHRNRWNWQRDTEDEKSANVYDRKNEEEEYEQSKEFSSEETWVKRESEFKDESLLSSGSLESVAQDGSEEDNDDSGRKRHPPQRYGNRGPKHWRGGKRDHPRGDGEWRDHPRRDGKLRDHPRRDGKWRDHPRRDGGRKDSHDEDDRSKDHNDRDDKRKDLPDGEERKKDDHDGDGLKKDHHDKDDRQKIYYDRPGIGRRRGKDRSVLMDRKTGHLPAGQDRRRGRFKGHHTRGPGRERMVSDRG